MSATTIHDIKPEIIEGMLSCVKIKHQFTDTGWKQLHRLVGTIEVPLTKEPLIVYGGWTAYENPAILSAEELAAACGFFTDDATIGGEPTQGFLAFSEYWEDQMPRIVRFVAQHPSHYDPETAEWDKVKPEEEASGVAEVEEEANDDAFALRESPSAALPSPLSQFYTAVGGTLDVNAQALQHKEPTLEEPSDGGNPD